MKYFVPRPILARDSDFLAVKWERLHNSVTGWVKGCLSFVIFYAILFYVHGNLTRLRNLNKII